MINRGGDIGYPTVLHRYWVLLLCSVLHSTCARPRVAFPALHSKTLGLIITYFVVAIAAAVAFPPFEKLSNIFSTHRLGLQSQPKSRTSDEGFILMSFEPSIHLTHRRQRFENLRHGRGEICQRFGHLRRGKREVCQRFVNVRCSDENLSRRTFEAPYPSLTYEG